ncbi:MAG: transposase [Verrucomicrobia bacterium]|nr:transposase [Verrucomicrobiota bacterium]
MHQTDACVIAHLKNDRIPCGTPTINLSTPKKKGRPPVSFDIILRALLFRLHEGCCWRTLSIFAPHTTIYTRWKKWCDEGFWERILESLSASTRG